jgi:hypothetical protein
MEGEKKINEDIVSEERGTVQRGATVEIGLIVIDILGN